MERDFVCIRVQAKGVIGSSFVEEKKVYYSCSSNNEGEEEVEGKEPGKSCIVY